MRWGLPAGGLSSGRSLLPAWGCDHPITCVPHPPQAATLPQHPAVPRLVPGACAEELQPRRVFGRVGSPHWHSTSAGVWQEVRCWYSKESILQLRGKKGKSQPIPHPDWPKNRKGQCLCLSGVDHHRGAGGHHGRISLTKDPSRLLACGDST